MTLTAILVGVAMSALTAMAQIPALASDSVFCSPSRFRGVTTI